ncbi:hypothetical protein HXX76_007491 [Chlamydomonas incerta]|uniref:SET domain-containing protein n=1 Tax=Chlamydomonas incerta TaxID=51695 RepID=A0A835SZJ3_CHLIN|nr:hypothetical protein HXX76_007491 [Chlamydomonas incerta]|eukprot:KAG2434596.1 hypothetical protein HXX76_007491 [Chlamydomonas incerta]
MPPSKKKDGKGPKAPAADGAAMSGARSSLAEFEDWMTKAGITWDTSVITLRAGDGDAAGRAQPATADAPWAVYAVSDVPAGHVLATLPRGAVLSAASCGLAAVLRAERLGGGLALVAGVMYEAARGPASKWHGYLRSLPRREYLPVFWSRAQLEALGGTDLAGQAEDDRASMAADFAAHVEPLLGRYPGRLGRLAGGWHLEAFMHAASWVASRAFYVDDTHGDALVPLADVFNHKAARVDLGEDSGWSAGFVVAEQEDAKQMQKKMKRAREEAEAAAEEAEEEAEEQGEQEDGGEDEGEEASSEGGEGDDDADEDEDEDEDEEDEDEEGGDEDGDGDKAGKKKRRKPTHAELDQPQPDDGPDAWPPPPPPPSPSSRPAAAAAAAAAAALAAAPSPAEGPAGTAARVAAAQGLGISERVRGRWRLLAERAVGGAGSGGGAGRNLHLDIGICAGERGGVELLDIVAAQPLAAGAEVYNTYGEHGNAELVKKYGFALPCNAFDEVLLDKGALLAAAEALLAAAAGGGKKALRRRTQFLEKFSDLLSDDDEPWLLLPPRHVNTACWAALQVLAATDAQLGGWRSMEDVTAPLKEAHEREQQAAAAAGRGVKRSAAEAEAAEQAAGEGQEEEEAGKQPPSQQQPAAKRVKGADGAAAKATATAGTSGAKGDEQEEDEDEDGGEEEADEKDSDDDDDDDGLPGDVEIPAFTTALQPADSPAAAAAVASGAKGKGKGKGKAAAAALGDKKQGANGKAAAAAAAEAAEAAGGGAEAGALWTEGMRRLLLRAVQERLGAYPTTLQADERELAAAAAGAAAEAAGEVAEATEEQAKEQGKGKGKGKKTEGASSGAHSCTPAEAAAARSCALWLRVGEKRLLGEVAAALRGGAEGAEVAAKGEVKA